MIGEPLRSALDSSAILFLCARICESGRRKKRKEKFHQPIGRSTAEH
jgi:hypothetical protein